MTRAIHRSVRDLLAQEMDDRLPARERLLCWLLLHPFQETEDLAVVLDQHRASVSRLLARLRAAGHVEAVVSGGGPGWACVWYLTSMGIAEGAAHLDADPGRLASWCGVQEAGLLARLPRMPLLVTLQRLIRGLLPQAPRLLADAGTPTATLRWQWQADYRLPYTQHGQRHACRVDAVFLFARQSLPEEPGTPGYYLSALWFLDPGWTGPADLRLIRGWLHAFLRARSWQEAQTPGVPFPPLLLVTATAEQQSVWQRCIAELVPRLQVAPLHGAIVSVAAQDLVSSTWQLPWQGLSSGRGTHLRQLFVPVPRQAILPEVLAPRSLPAGLVLPRESSRQTGLVTGHFVHRAGRLPILAPSTRAAPPVMRMTRETRALTWLGLSRMQQALLHLLYTHPLLDRTGAAILMQSTPAEISRAASQLRRQQLIQVHSTSQGRVLTVSGPGLDLLAARFQVPVSQLVEEPRESSDVLVQRGLPTTTEARTRQIERTRLFVRCQQDAQAQGQHLRWWELGGRAAWSYPVGSTWVTFAPDAALAYTTATTTLLAWVEWIEQDTPGRALRTRLQSYARFLPTRLWAQGRVQRPLLLLIVADGQAEHLARRLAGRLLVGLHLVLYVTTRPLLFAEGLLAPIWRRELPDQGEDDTAWGPRTCWVEQDGQDIPKTERRRKGSENDV